MVTLRKHTCAPSPPRLRPATNPYKIPLLPIKSCKRTSGRAAVFYHRPESNISSGARETRRG